MAYKVQEFKTLYTVGGAPFLFDPTIPPPHLLTKRPHLPPPTIQYPGNHTHPTTNNFRRQPLQPRLPTHHNKPKHSPVKKHLQSLTSNIFRFLQLTHHRRNWTSFPKSLVKRLDTFCRDINPPMRKMDASLQDVLWSFTEDYKEGIQMGVRNHLDEQLELIENQLLIETQLRDVSLDEVEEASRGAEMQLQQRLQRRFNKRNCAGDLAQVRELMTSFIIDKNVSVTSEPVTNLSPSVSNPDQNIESPLNMDTIELNPPTTPKAKTELLKQFENTTPPPLSQRKKRRDPPRPDPNRPAEGINVNSPKLNLTIATDRPEERKDVDSPISNPGIVTQKPSKTAHPIHNVADLKKLPTVSIRINPYRPTAENRTVKTSQRIKEQAALRTTNRRK
jgi:hypothetical protein